MKHLLKFSILILLVILTFSSCKKEQIEVLEPREISNNSLILKSTNLAYNDLTISPRLVPSEISDATIEVKVTSNADPVGFTFNATLRTDTVVDIYSEPRQDFYFKTFSETVYAANETDAIKKKIKVDKEGDYINVTIGENVISTSSSFNSSLADNRVNVLYTYWHLDFEASIVVYGYNFEGSGLTINIHSTRDDIPIEHSGVFKESDTGFPSYEYDVKFNNGWSYQVEPPLVGVYPDADTIFINIWSQVTFFTEYNKGGADILPIWE